jgi:hypothetical protein
MTTRSHSPHGILSHLFTDRKGDVVALHRGPRGDFVLLGTPGEPLRQVPIDRLEVRRDGGTTIARTREGTLHVPSSLSARDAAGQGPTWNGGALARADASEYDIDLSGRPTIAPKASAAPAP